MSHTVVKNEFLTYLMQRYSDCVSRIEKRNKLAIATAFSCLTIFIVVTTINSFFPSNVLRYIAYFGVMAFMLIGIVLSFDAVSNKEFNEINNLQSELSSHLDLKMLNEISKLAVDEKTQGLLAYITPHNEKALMTLHYLWMYSPI